MNPMLITLWVGCGAAAVAGYPRSMVVLFICALAQSGWENYRQHKLLASLVAKRKS